MWENGIFKLISLKYLSIIYYFLRLQLVFIEDD